MKHLIITLLLLAAVSPAMAQSQTLVLHHADGRTTEVELYTMPRIQMKSDKMIITSQGISQEYSKTDVLRFTYKGVGTGISNVCPATSFRIDEDRITFHGVPETGAVKIYDAQGMQIPVGMTTVGSDAVLLLAQLPKGVYLVSINERTIKIVRP